MKHDLTNLNLRSPKLYFERSHDKDNIFVKNNLDKILQQHIKQ